MNIRDEKFFISKGTGVKEFLEKRISSNRTQYRGDFDVCNLINKGVREKLIPAAVLILVIKRNNNITVIFTKRNNNLKNHAGQISFPGGKMEISDTSIENTARRETMEEIGLNIKPSEILGKMSTWETRTGFLITPVLGFISDPPKMRKNIYEVEEIFEVPINYLMNPKNHKIEKRSFEKKSYEFFTIQYLDYYIWGATAGLIINLYNILR